MQKTLILIGQLPASRLSKWRMENCRIKHNETFSFRLNNVFRLPENKNAYIVDCSLQRSFILGRRALNFVSSRHFGFAKC